MSKFEESNFYKTLQDFFINADKKTFLQFLAEFYNRTESIIDKDNIQDDLIKELRELYLEFNEKGIDENIVREKVNYFVENNEKMKNINKKLNNIEQKIKEINVVVDLGCKNDSKFDNTEILQNAIEKHKDSGVVLYFPKGVYCHKGLTLYSNINILGENPNNTKLKNISTTNDSIKLIGGGYDWPQEYFIKDIQITSDKITGDTRKGINNKINRNYRYENVKINNHKYGLFETD